MNAMLLYERTIHSKIPFLVAESFRIRDNEIRRIFQSHQISGFRKEGIAIQSVATAEVVDASWQRHSFLYILDNLPYISHTHDIRAWQP